MTTHALSAESAPSPERPLTRRDLLAKAGGGCGLLGLAALIAGEQPLSSAARADESRTNLALNPMAPRPTHFAPKAKRVIWIFVNGGPSQVDTWDYKPELEKRDGQDLPGFDKFTGFFSNAVGGLMKSPFKFAQHGQCGKWVSE